MKVIYVGGKCPFCEGFPETSIHEDRLTVNRAYVVTEQHRIIAPWGEGIGYLLAGVTITEGWYWCSCAFREVKGDSEAWERILERAKPKPEKILEPA
jgi:hypothetical protein